MAELMMYRVVCPPHSGGGGTVMISERFIAEVCPGCKWKNKKCRPLPVGEVVSIPELWSWRGKSDGHG